MASSNGNRELILTQDKLEWVTPKILEMSAALTDGKAYGLTREVCDWRCTQGFVNPFNGNTYPGVGPS